MFTILSFVVTGEHIGWESFFENNVKAFVLIATLDVCLALLGFGQEEE
jgi:hypothetical protein